MIFSIGIRLAGCRQFARIVAIDKVQLNSVVNRPFLSLAKSRDLDREQVCSIFAGISFQSLVGNDVWVMARDEGAQIKDDASNGDIRLCTILTVKAL